MIFPPWQDMDGVGSASRKISTATPAYRRIIA